MSDLDDRIEALEIPSVDELVSQANARALEASQADQTPPLDDSSDEAKTPDLRATDEVPVQGSLFDVEAMQEDTSETSPPEVPTSHELAVVDKTTALIDEVVAGIAEREAAIAKHLALLRHEVGVDLDESADAENDAWLAAGGAQHDDLKAVALGKFDTLGEDDEPVLDPSRLKRMLKPLALGALALVAVIGAIIYFGYFGGGVTRVPDLIGLSTVQATASLEQSGLAVGKIIEEESSSVATGIVLNQDPKVDSLVARGSTVTLIISGQSRIVSVPNVAEMTPEEARTELNQARLSMEVVPTYDAVTPEGAIVGQLPVAETLVDPGSTVTVLVSLGLPGTQIPTPRVMGLSAEDAQSVLERAGFLPLPYRAQTAFGRTGEVVAQTPATGSLTYPGTPVQYLISEKIAGADSTVPDTVGMREENAILVMNEAGFEVLTHPYIDSQATTGTVVAQMPLPQDMLIRRGDTVELLVARGTDIHHVVPSVLGQNASVARETLRSIGFRPIMVPLPSSMNESTVYQQFPAGESEYYLGLPVLLYAGRPSK